MSDSSTITVVSRDSGSVTITISPDSASAASVVMSNDDLVEFAHQILDAAEPQCGLALIDDGETAVIYTPTGETHMSAADVAMLLEDVLFEDDDGAPEDLIDQVAAYLADHLDLNGEKARDHLHRMVTAAFHADPNATGTVH